MKKHDENKDLKLFSRIGRVNLGDNTLRASKKATIGIHMWGRIDFLTRYCGWHFVWDNTASTKPYKEDDTSKKADIRAKKKEAKAPKLTNKKRK